MTQTLYLLQNQNNYFNRKVILQGVRTLEEIQNNEKLISVHSNINVGTFDSLTCNIIINTDYNFGVVANVPDYAVINSVRDDGTEELTRWFVETYSKVRGEQYAIFLKRDVLADYLGTILVSPCFIEKGFVPRNNPLIYNGEGMVFNQIKQLEEPLYEGRTGPWIIGYMARTDNNQEYELDVTTDAYQPANTVIDYANLPTRIQQIIKANDGYYVDEESSYFEVSYIALLSNSNSQYERIEFQYNLANGTAKNLLSKYERLDGTPTPLVRLFNWKESVPGGGLQLFSVARLKESNEALGKNLIANGVIPLIKNAIDDASLVLTDEEINTYNGIVYKRDGNYYRITINKSEEIGEYSPILNNNNALQLACMNAIDDAKVRNTNVFDRILIPSTNFIKAYYPKLQVTNVSVSGPSYRVHIPKTRKKLVDAPYDMFAIAINPPRTMPNGNSRYMPRESLVAIAQAIGVALGSRLYDLQLLPYQPYEETIDTNLATSSLVENEDFAYISEVGNGGQLTNVSVVLFPTTSKRRFSIKSESLKEYSSDSYVTKVKDATTMYRLVSPNYNGIYEFSLQKNGGIVSQINVDIEYKPFQPFIKLSLQYGGINIGALEDPNIVDGRGLICGGDFSLTQINSAWTNYQINNKNFQLMFDRQIQNVEVGQSLAREQLQQNINFGFLDNSIKAIGELAKLYSSSSSKTFGTNAFMSAANISGAFTKWAIGSENDRRWQGISQKEELDYLNDKFNYSLQNVMALPYSLTKVSALNSTFKDFPFLEVYSSTSMEKEAFRNKLHYDGMTVMKIDQIINYVDISNENFVKGRLVRIEGASIDNNLAKAIYDEVSKGFYIDIGGYTSGN